MPTKLKTGSGHGGFQHGYGIVDIVFFTMSATVGGLHMLPHNVFRRDHHKLPPQDGVPAGVHRAVADRTDTFIIGQLMNDLLGGQLA